MIAFLRALCRTPGVSVILVLSLLSTGALLVIGGKESRGMELWLFSTVHATSFAPYLEEWNDRHRDTDERVTVSVLSVVPLERRLVSGFVSGTPVPDMAEVEISMIGSFFAGPFESVGLMDLTDRLKEEGIYAAFNQPSFSPWTRDGRIFGLPHDVHPVLLGYRADIVEAAGIDVNEIETWDDFERLMGPLVKDGDGDGYPDRYLLNVWDSGHFGALTILMRQAGGRFFDDDGGPALASRANARVFARVVTWISGPGRIATLAPPFSAEGNQMYLEGTVLTEFMPDWRTGVWRRDLAPLSGKVKLMPLPAWEPGGIRTSVRGGTMMGIPKRAGNPELAWEFAKGLYLSAESAERLFKTSGSISPVKALWDHPMYQQPDPYFCNQRVGALYVKQAPHVPPRRSSPFLGLARQEVSNALIRTRRWAEETGTYDLERLEEVALGNLREADDKIWRHMARNVFLDLPSRDQPQEGKP